MPIRNPPTNKLSAPFTPGQLRGIATAMVDLILANVLYAIAGIEVFGQQPFAGLRAWGDDLVETANNAYSGAINAQSSADYANAQLVGLTVTDVSGGVSLSSTFSGVTATNIGGSFTQVYSGPGGGTWGLDGDGNTIWNKSGGNYRVCIARHNTAVSTDYQQIRVVMVTTPSPSNFGAYPTNFLCARINSACDEYVYVRFSSIGAAIGYAIAGSRTDLDSASFTMKVGDTLDFFVGTDNDDREFIVKRNSDVILSAIDSGAASSMGASNRYVGLGCFTADANFFTDQRVAGKVTAWGGIDRQPTTY